MNILPKLNLATKFTVLRIILVPVLATLVYYGRHDWALLVFCMAALSDAADGFIARVFRQKTPLGAYLDPLADKLLLMTCFIVFTFSENLHVVLPGWVTLSVVFRDIIILVGIAVIYILSPSTLKIKPTIISKLTTVFQVATIFEVTLSNYLVSVGGSDTLYLQINSALCHITTGLCIVSGLDYIRIGLKILTATHPQKNTSGHVG